MRITSAAGTQTQKQNFVKSSEFPDCSSMMSASLQMQPMGVRPKKSKEDFGRIKEVLGQREIP